MNEIADNEVQWTIVHKHLKKIYGESLAEKWFPTFRDQLQNREYKRRENGGKRKSFCHKDSLLICYADHIFDKKGNLRPLTHLHHFFDKNLKDQFSGIHLLPFFPATSDAGFAVKDYKSVSPTFGEWQDIDLFSCDLMFDAVFNHTSSEHEWFQNFLLGVEPYKEFYLAYSQEEILDSEFQKQVKLVTRPRPTPLFSRYRSVSGDVFCWTTFSHDQVDVNFHSPELLYRLIDVLLFYVDKGSNYLRIDAIPYLWKELGTNCLHLEKTHLVVKLMRSLLDIYAPSTVLITESNVPHEENISYFGNGHDEAQMVYNFSLPPLILHSFVKGDGQAIKSWAASIDFKDMNENTFFNFTSSHDGVGVRPLEGLISDEEIQNLCQVCLEKGGKISARSTSTGDKPYELNITWASFLYDGNSDEDVNTNAYLMTHAICLSFPGVPGIYFHNLFGAFNYYQSFNLTRHRRDLNRRKYSLSRLKRYLNNEGFHKKVYEGMIKMLAVRRSLDCLSPQSRFHLFESPDSVWCFGRENSDAGSKGLFIYNFSTSSCEFVFDSRLQEYFSNNLWECSFTGTQKKWQKSMVLGPQEFYWLECV